MTKHSGSGITLEEAGEKGEKWENRRDDIKERTYYTMQSGSAKTILSVVQKHFTTSPTIQFQ